MIPIYVHMVCPANAKLIVNTVQTKIKSVQLVYETVAACVIRSRIAIAQYVFSVEIYLAIFFIASGGPRARKDIPGKKKKRRKTVKLVNMQDVSDVIVHLQRFSWSDYLVFVCMLLLCIFIGIYFGFFEKKNSTESEYLVGDRNLKIFPIALSLVAR